MKKIVALVAVAGLTAAASAAGNLVLSMVPQSASIGPGGTMVMDVYADWSGVTGGLSLAGWKFDIIGDANGTLAGAVNSTNFNQGINNGIVSAPTCSTSAAASSPRASAAPTTPTPPTSAPSATPTAAPLRPTTPSLSPSLTSSPPLARSTSTSAPPAPRAALAPPAPLRPTPFSSRSVPST
ncbi:MAG: hypothetical protein KF705_13485 [Phycisphaeraceae bacterium]|nr:hypothetical protein [Phycisphaeraceae bacterium]